MTWERQWQETLDELEVSEAERIRERSPWYRLRKKAADTLGEPQKKDVAVNRHPGFETKEELATFLREGPNQWNLQNLSAYQATEKKQNDGRNLISGAYSPAYLQRVLPHELVTIIDILDQSEEFTNKFHSHNTHTTVGYFNTLTQEAASWKEKGEYREFLQTVQDLGDINPELGFRFADTTDLTKLREKLGKRRFDLWKNIITKRVMAEGSVIAHSTWIGGYTSHTSGEKLNAFYGIELPFDHSATHAMKAPQGVIDDILEAARWVTQQYEGRKIQVPRNDHTKRGLVDHIFEFGPQVASDLPDGTTLKEIAVHALRIYDLDSALGKRDERKVRIHTQQGRRFLRQIPRVLEEVTEIIENGLEGYTNTVQILYQANGEAGDKFLEHSPKVLAAAKEKPETYRSWATLCELTARVDAEFISGTADYMVSDVIPSDVSSNLLSEAEGVARTKPHLACKFLKVGFKTRGNVFRYVSPAQIARKVAELEGEGRGYESSLSAPYLEGLSTLVEHGETIDPQDPMNHVDEVVDRAREIYLKEDNGNVRSAQLLLRDVPRAVARLKSQYRKRGYDLFSKVVEHVNVGDRGWERIKLFLGLSRGVRAFETRFSGIEKLSETRPSVAARLLENAYDINGQRDGAFETLLTNIETLQDNTVAQEYITRVMTLTQRSREKRRDVRRDVQAWTQKLSEIEKEDVGRAVEYVKSPPHLISAHNLKNIGVEGQEVPVRQYSGELIKTLQQCEYDGFRVVTLPELGELCRRGYEPNRASSILTSSTVALGFNREGKRRIVATHNPQNQYTQMRAWVNQDGIPINQRERNIGEEKQRFYETLEEESDLTTQTEARHWPSDLGRSGFASIMHRELAVTNIGVESGREGWSFGPLTPYNEGTIVAIPKDFDLTQYCDMASYQNSHEILGESIQRLEIRV